MTHLPLDEQQVDVRASATCRREALLVHGITVDGEVVAVICTSISSGCSMRGRADSVARSADGSLWPMPLLAGPCSSSSIGSNCQWGSGLTHMTRPQGPACVGQTFLIADVRVLSTPDWELDACDPDCILASRECPGLSCCWLLCDSASEPRVEVTTLRATLAKAETTCVDPTCSQDSPHEPGEERCRSSCSL